MNERPLAIRNARLAWAGRAGAAVPAGGSPTGSACTNSWTELNANRIRTRRDHYRDLPFIIQEEQPGAESDALRKVAEGQRLRPC
jgi:hypothetical protein